MTSHRPVPAQHQGKTSASDQKRRLRDTALGQVWSTESMPSSCTKPSAATHSTGQGHTRKTGEHKNGWSESAAHHAQQPARILSLCRTLASAPSQLQLQKAHVALLQARLREMQAATEGRQPAGQSREKSEHPSKATSPMKGQATETMRKRKRH